MRYIGRNIFLDNTAKKEYIKAQLQKAIEIAKKRWPGYGCSSVKKTDKVG